MTKPRWFLASCMLVLVLGCEFSPRSGFGLRLPDGNVGRGEVAFQDLGCPACHDVAGGPSAPSGVRSDAIVTLGGEVTRVETYGELVTSIINPSHEISRRYPKEDVADGDVSKMPNFNSKMTVAQLIDLTAFLQSTYEVRVEPVYVP